MTWRILVYVVSFGVGFCFSGVINRNIRWHAKKSRSSFWVVWKKRRKVGRMKREKSKFSFVNKLKIGCATANRKNGKKITRQSLKSSVNSKKKKENSLKYLPKKCSRLFFFSKSARECLNRSVSNIWTQFLRIPCTWCDIKSGGEKNNVMDFSSIRNTVCF